MTLADDILSGKYDKPFPPKLGPGVESRLEEITLDRETFLEIHKGKDAEDTLMELYLWFDIKGDDVL